jgi:hypothetical protein
MHAPPVHQLFRHTRGEREPLILLVDLAAAGGPSAQSKAVHAQIARIIVDARTHASQCKRMQSTVPSQYTHAVATHRLGSGHRNDLRVARSLCGNGPRAPNT